MTLPDWWPSWEGTTIIIVASGPSAKDVHLDIARGRARFIAVNASWRLAPWADMLFGCDVAWWKSVAGCPEFGGLKLSTDFKVTETPGWGVQWFRTRKPDDRMVFEELGSVGWGGNSGFQAFNLAVQFKPTKILLVGFDMTLRNGLHWHGAHEGGLHNPTVHNIERWRRAVDSPAEEIAALGIKVVNCSAESALRNYPKMTFEEALTA